MTCTFGHENDFTVFSSKMTKRFLIPKMYVIWHLFKILPLFTFFEVLTQDRLFSSFLGVYNLSFLLCTFLTYGITTVPLDLYFRSESFFQSMNFSFQILILSFLSNKTMTTAIYRPCVWLTKPGYDRTVLIRRFSFQKHIRSKRKIVQCAKHGARGRNETVSKPRTFDDTSRHVLKTLV